MSEEPLKKRRCDPPNPNDDFRRSFLRAIPNRLWTILGKDFPEIGFARYTKCFSSLLRPFPPDEIKKFVNCPVAFFDMVESLVKQTRGKSRESFWGGSAPSRNVLMEMRDLLGSAIAKEDIDTKRRLDVAPKLSLGQIVHLLVEKFRFGRLPLSESWQKDAALENARRRDEEGAVLSSRHPLETFTHVSFCHGRRSLPMDVFIMILSYLKHDYSLLCSVGLVCEEFFVAFLLSWQEIHVLPATLRAISLVALRSASSIHVVSPFDLSTRKVFLSKSDWQYFFSGIHPQRISKLDLSDTGVMPKGFREFLVSLSGLQERPVFPGCTSLSFPAVEDLRDRMATSLFRRCIQDTDLLTAVFPNLTTLENVSGAMGRLVEGASSIRSAHFVYHLGLSGVSSTALQRANSGLNELSWLGRVRVCGCTLLWHWNPRNYLDRPPQTISLDEVFTLMPLLTSVTDMMLSSRPSSSSTRLVQGYDSWKSRRISFSPPRMTQKLSIVYECKVVFAKITLASEELELQPLKSLSIHCGFLGGRDLALSLSDLCGLLDPREGSLHASFQSVPTGEYARLPSYDVWSSTLDCLSQIDVSTIPIGGFTLLVSQPPKRGDSSEIPTAVRFSYFRDHCSVHCLAPLRHRDWGVRTMSQLLNLVDSRVRGLPGQGIAVSLMIYVDDERKIEALVALEDVATTIQRRSVEEWPFN